jgi:mono/diheme cytochrome c family protein
MSKVSLGKRDDYSRLVAAALVLSIGILVAFQIYMLREPDRIQSVLASDQAERVTRGQQLFTANCATCHGQHGEGDIGPTLNSKRFLQTADDGIIFSLIGSGVPGSGMPSWAQANGGPFTDEQISDLVGFIRSWQATATDVAKPTPTPNPAQGATIFNSICYACHGPNGEGTDRAPALNDQKLLAQFDDAWFRQTISQGRPSKGMPTWGKVLSPEQINSVVAYIRQFAQISAPASAAPTKVPTAAPSAAPANATTAPKPTAAPTTSSIAPTAAATTEASQAPQPNCGKPDCTKPGPAIAKNLKGDPTAGQKVFVENCEKCHGSQGKIGIANPGSTDGSVPSLNPIDSAFSTLDANAFAAQIDAFVEHGSTPEGPSPKNVMDSWGDSGKLTPQQIADVIAYLISLNK